MMNKTLPVLFVLFTLQVWGQFPTEGQQQAIQDLLDEESLDEKFKGLHCYYSSAAGNWSHFAGESHAGTPLDTSMYWLAASNTKVFTASLILTLKEEGLLNLSDPLHQFLPRFDHIDSTITVEQLLTHTSGLYDYAQHPNLFLYVLTDSDSLWEPENVLSTFIAEPYTAPGQTYWYSNTNYLLLGMIAEAVTNNSLDAELQSRFIAPQGLTQTYIGPHPIADQLAAPWAKLNGTDLSDLSAMDKTAMLSIPFGAGNLIGKPVDLCKWLSALLEEQVLSTSNTLLLKETSIQSESSDFGIDGYGHGIDAHYFGGDQFYGHVGSLVHESHVFYNTDEHYCLALFSNSQNDAMHGLFDRVVDILQDPFVSTPEYSLPHATLYPNPAHHHVFVESVFPANQSPKLLSVLGKEVLVDRFRQTSNRWKIDTQSLEAGTYFVLIKQEDETIHLPFVKF